MTTSYISDKNKSVHTPTPLTVKERSLKKAKSNELIPSFVNIDRDIKTEDIKNPKIPTPPEDAVLSKEEQLFLDLHLDLSNPMSAQDCAKMSFPDLKDSAGKGKRLLAKPNIQKSIQIRQQVNSYVVPYTEDDVIKALWTEATRLGEGCSHSARVTALVQLGKHIGILGSGGAKVETSEERAASGPTYNIINYNSPELDSKLAALAPKDIQESSEALDEAELNDVGAVAKNLSDSKGIKVQTTDYSILSPGTPESPRTAKEEQ